MKKNRMMRLASALLVAVLLTTCAISGTFAKYVTTASASDTARVAEWGVEIVATTDAFFDDTYNKEDGIYTGTFSVNAEGEDVVAPGTTKANLTNLTLEGTPEVATRVEYIGRLSLSGWEIDEDGDPATPETVEYCPIRITVEGKEFYIGGTDLNGDSIDHTGDLKVAVEDAIAKCSKDYDPNEDLSSVAVTNDAPTVTWSWPYHVDEATDVKDTALGNNAADGSPAEIELTINVSVTQID